MFIPTLSNFAQYVQILKDFAFTSVQGPSLLSLVHPIFGTFVFDVLRWQQVIFADVVPSLHMFN